MKDEYGTALVAIYCGCILVALGAATVMGLISTRGPEVMGGALVLAGLLMAAFARWRPHLAQWSGAPGLVILVCAVVLAGSE